MYVPKKCGRMSLIFFTYHKFFVSKSVHRVLVAIYNRTELISFVYRPPPNYSPPVEPLQQPEAPIGRELGVANNKKREGDPSVALSHGAPQQVLDHGVILVLASTIVCMQIHCLLTCKLNFKTFSLCTSSLCAFLNGCALLT